jgi:hypothetical protein
VPPVREFDEILSVPGRDPAALGLNATMTEQELLGVSVDGQSLLVTT